MAPFSRVRVQFCRTSLRTARWLKGALPSSILESNLNHKTNYEAITLQGQMEDKCGRQLSVSRQPQAPSKAPGHRAPSLELTRNPEHLRHLDPASQCRRCGPTWLSCLLLLLVKYRFYFPSTLPAAQTKPNSTPDFLHTF